MKKSRPAIIINIDGLGRLPLRVIVPITDWKERYSQYPWMVKIESGNQNVFNRLFPNQVGIG